MTDAVALPPHIALALTQVGAKEIPKGSNRGPVVDKYTGGRAEAWCGHFVAWCFREVFKPIPGDKVPSPKQHNDLASVSHTERLFKEHGWHHREPQVGDVVFFLTRGRSDRGPGRHIGLVAEVTLTDIQVVDGNWGDSVALHRVKRSDPGITGYGRMP